MPNKEPSSGIDGIDLRTVARWEKSGAMLLKLPRRGCCSRVVALPSVYSVRTMLGNDGKRMWKRKHEEYIDVEVKTIEIEQ